MRENQEGTYSASDPGERLTRRDLVVRSARVSGGLVAASGVAGWMGVGRAGAAAHAGVPGAPTISQVTVPFGIGPYVDHSYWIIGAKNGWFKEVGINLTPGPAGRSSDPSTWGPVLISRTVDVQSSSESHYLPSMKTARNLRQLIWTDLFQGFAILVRPDLGLKPASDFIAGGQTPSTALTSAVSQLKGKRLVFSPESAIRTFVETVFARAGVSLSQAKTTILEDPKQVPLMLTGRADAQVSGVPIRLTLQAKGFKPIVSAADLVKAAKPSADSPELLTVFRDGAATTAEWYEKNQDTALRLASVVFRITDLINRDPQTAANLQRPFVNSIAGTALTTKDVLTAYTSLDPFFTFDAQRPWYEDQTSPFYYKYEIGAYIKFWQKKGLFKPGQITVDDIAINKVVYDQLTKLRKESAAVIAQTKQRLKSPTSDAAKLLSAAQDFYNHFNYLDASRFAKAAQSKV